MDVIGGIAAASQAIGIAKGLRQIEKGFDAATYRAEIADLLNALTDAKLALTDAKETLAERDKEIERLKSAFEQRGELVKAAGDYSYFADEAGKPRGYPVCPKCEHDGRIVQMKRDGMHNKARCPVCSSGFTPVTSYKRTESGDILTTDDEARSKREAEDARIQASLREAGRRLA